MIFPVCFAISFLYFFYPLVAILPPSIKISLYFISIIYCFFAPKYTTKLSGFNQIVLFLLVAFMVTGNTLVVLHIFLPLYFAISIFSILGPRTYDLLVVYFYVYLFDGLRSIAMNLLGFSPIIIHPWSLVGYLDNPVSNMSQYTSASIAKISTIFPIPYTHVFSLILVPLSLIYLISQNRNPSGLNPKLVISSTILLLLAVQTKSILLPLFIAVVFIVTLRSFLTATVSRLVIFSFFVFLILILSFINPILSQINFYSVNNIFDFYFIPLNMPPICLLECPTVNIPYTEFHIFAKFYQYGLLPVIFLFITVFYCLLFPFNRLSQFSIEKSSYLLIFSCILLGDLLHYVKFLYAPSVFALFLALFCLKSNYLLSNYNIKN